MRILYHHRTQAEDAQGIHINEMVNAFVNLGHQVQVAALRKENHENGQTTLGWIACKAPSWFYEMMSLMYNIYGYRMLCQAIEEYNPHFIYERYSLNTLCGLWASKKYKIPLILEVNAPLSIEQDNLGKLSFKTLATKTERWLCSNSACTIVVTDVLKELLSRRGVPESNMVTIHNGINNKEFNLDVSGDSVINKYNLHNTFVIGFVGWMREWHGLESLIETIDNLKSTCPKIRLLLVGDGPSYNQLFNLTESKNLHSHVIFTGPIKRQDIPAFIAAMDVAIQPNVTEYASPIKLFEYMALGKAIIAPQKNNIMEIVRDNENALLFDVNNKITLQEKIELLYNNSSLVKQLGLSARKRLDEANYFWESNARRVIEIVSNIKTTQ